MDFREEIAWAKAKGACPPAIWALSACNSREECWKVLKGNSGWRVWYARNTADAIALTALSKDEDWNVRCAVAMNPNTPQEALTALSKDKDYDVRWEVAIKPNTPQEILTALSKDEDRGVRCAVARNPNFRKE